MKWTPYRVAVLMDGDKQVAIQNCFTGATEIQHEDKRYRRVDDEHNKAIPDSEGRHVFKRIKKAEEDWIQQKWIPENYGPEAEKAREEDYELAEGETPEARGKQHRKMGPRKDKPSFKHREKAPSGVRKPRDRNSR